MNFDINHFIQLISRLGKLSEEISSISDSEILAVLTAQKENIAVMKKNFEGLAHYIEKKYNIDPLE